MSILQLRESLEVRRMVGIGLTDPFLVSYDFSLPSSISQAFTDPSKVRSSRLQAGFNTVSSEPDGPPYPLHAPSSQPYLHGMSAPSIQAEGDRLDIARIEAVRELERERTRLIDVEKELRKVREKIDGLTSNGAGATSAAVGGTKV